jgi:hypothetical protein
VRRGVEDTLRVLTDRHRGDQVGEVHLHLLIADHMRLIVGPMTSEFKSADQRPRPQLAQVKG